MSACSDKNSLYTAIREASAAKLFNLLNSINGTKDLVLDNELISSLDYIANFLQLKDCNVEKVFKLEPGAAPGKTERCVYIIRPGMQNSKIIADHINASKSIGSNKKFWILHVPRKLYYSELVLEREGVYGYVTQLELPICFFALDKDLFSLELPDFFNSFFVKGDTTYVHTAATALVQLCKMCGSIPKTFGQGRCAEMVVDLMKLILDQTVENSLGTDHISHLIILDRDIDYVSVLLSQLTYEGMLDEVFGINNSRIIFPTEVTGKEDSLKVILNSSDVIYEEIRNSYFASVFGFLSSKAKELQSKTETTNMSLADMKNFVTNEIRNVRQQQSSLSLHVGACEVIMKQKNENDFQEHLQVERDIIENQNLKKCIDYIEDEINQQESYISALRLMCLLSIAQDGLLSSEYLSLATQFRQSFGCKYLPTLFKLKNLCLFMEQASFLPSGQTTAGKIVEKVGTGTASKIAEKVATAVALSKYSSFKTILRKFNLIPNEGDEPDLKNPKNISYVFGGAYVPLIGRITEQIILHDSLKTIEDGMKLLPGNTIMRLGVNKESGCMKPIKDFDVKTILVYILGGITFAEVAALRLIGKLNGCRILIATSSLISGTSLLKMLSPPTSPD